ncbi:ABC transporter [Ignavigranum ruoffiae]|uniref:ABC transporter n=2 Tax=Ignavigranum ruoffiae TaxID=89093 RepID=A0A1H9GPI3_9LACT|nr:ATP-binding cassette domain-containing protein [Ignavigranum ruoffiae]SEQ51899.1 ABC transporter [Ignavigranum ruoffiae]
MSLIQQSVFIFDASIVENITMFRNFPQSDIDRVIQLAGLVELIESHGQDYNCGENGCNLSGGEKQRIAIARSLLQESEILLVDEATSALDNQTAANITQAILDLSGLMRIVVTHRLEEKFLQQYDQIVVLKEGKLIEQGTFNQLMAEKKYFYSLFTVAN